MNILCLLIEFAISLHVEYLGDRAFRRRNHSQSVLANLGEYAIPVLTRGVDHFDPEVSCRCQLLLDRQWSPLLECKKWLTRSDIPWIYLNGCYNSPASTTFLQRAYNAYRSTEVYGQWRDATRIWLQERLSEGSPPLWILQQIDAMRQAECNFNFRL